MIRYFAALGSAKASYFIRESRNWRVNRWFVLFAVVFLQEELEAGRLTLQSRDSLAGVISKVFSANLNDSSGALFQLSQIAYYHGKSLLSEDQPKVIAIEETRPSFVVVNGVAAGDPYRRRIDIIVEGPGQTGEDWIEVKSLIKKGFQPNQFKNNPFPPKTTKYKEFFHDLRLNTELISDDPSYKERILSGVNAMVNNQYTWYFHKFSRGKGISPTKEEERKVRKFLCVKPKSLGKKFYDFNMKKDAGGTAKACNTTAKDRIKLRDTESYITEIIKGLVVNLGLPLAGYLTAIDSIPVDSEWR